ncbi:hypothetical protein OG21DRAFT_1526044 [Imleria badia]|nr:hypothetical protein OG21DRAFT_1526044 [Imleria badia]
MDPSQRRPVSAADNQAGQFPYPLSPRPLLPLQAHASALSVDAYLPGCFARPTLPPTVCAVPHPSNLLGGACASDHGDGPQACVSERPLLKVFFRKGNYFQNAVPNQTQPAFASQERQKSFGDDRTMARAGHPYLVAHAARATSARRHVSPSSDLFRGDSPARFSDCSAASLPTTSSANYSNPSSSNFSEIPTACPPEVGLVTTIADDKDMSRQQALKEAEHIVIYEMLCRVGWPEIPAKRTTASVWKPTFREALNQACARRCIEITLTNAVATQFTRHLTEVRAVLATDAKGPAMALIESLVDSLLDQSIKADPVQLLAWKKAELSQFTTGDTTFYFMHQLNKDSGLTLLQRKVVDGKWFAGDELGAFHKAFWYGHRCSPLIHIDYTLNTTPTLMYALSATVLRFALRREVALETSFNTDRHAPELRKIYANLDSQINQRSLIGKNIVAHLRMLHQEGQFIASRMKRTTEQTRTDLIYIPPAEELHLHECRSSTASLDGPATAVNQPVPRPSNWPEGFKQEPGDNFLPVSFQFPAHCDAQSQLEEPEELSAYGPVWGANSLALFCARVPLSGPLLLFVGLLDYPQKRGRKPVAWRWRARQKWLDRRAAGSRVDECNPIANANEKVLLTSNPKGRVWT